MGAPALDLTLFPKQLRALRSLATEILYGGAAGGGKSHLMRVAAILWCSLIPGLQVYIFRRISGDLWRNHMTGPKGFLNMLAPWVKSGHVKINTSGRVTITFWNGAMIHLCHCQHEKDVIKYQGAEIHVLMIDELTHFTPFIYRYLRRCVRFIGVPCPPQFKHMFPRILCGSNPGGVGHNWVKEAFVTFTGYGNRARRAAKTEGGMLRAFIPAKLDDNPALEEDDPGYEDRLEGMGDPALVRAMRDGNWDIVFGGMFDDVWDYGAQTFESVEIPYTWRIDRSFDWGSSRPFSVGWWAETDDTPVRVMDVEGNVRALQFYPGSLIRIAEWYGWNGEPNVGCHMTSDVIAEGILERESQYELTGRVKPGPADNSIFGDMDDANIARTMADRGVRWTRANKAPGSRVQGWAHLRKMYLAAKKGPPYEAPGLFSLSRCEHYHRTMPVLPRDERNRDDVDTASEDHIGDDTRYRAYKKVVKAGTLKTIGV